MILNTGATTNAAIRFYKTRDSATSVLRKMGVQTREYNAFIETAEDGTFACHVAKAELHLVAAKPKVMAEVGNPIPEVDQVPVVSKVKRAGTAVQAEILNPKRSVTATAREMILDGKSNQEIWDVLKEAFGLGDDKKRYPSWYRNDMKRKGLIK